MKSNSQHGYVALIAVLIVGAVSLAIGVSLLLAGADSQRATLVTQQSLQARNITSACAEEGLETIRENNAFVGTSSVSIGLGTCSYVVTSTGTTTRTIDVTVTVNDVVRKAKVYVTIGASTISVTSWQEVI